MGIIYILTSPSGKQYVGQTIRTFDKRWKQHINDIKKAKNNNFGSGTCVALPRAFDKYGYENFEFETLFECDDCDLNMIEKKNDLPL